MEPIPLIRRIFLWVFIASFVVIAPAVVFYTAGYRWNPKKGAVERNGTLIVDTTPAGARIALNGEVTEKDTPFTFKNLAPGTYEILLELEGYYPWSKTLDIRPELVTFANNIELWRRSDPERLVSGAFANFSASKNSRYAAGSEVVDGKTVVKIAEISSGQITEAVLSDAGTDQTVASLEWDADSSALLVRMKQGHPYLVTRRNPEVAIALPDGAYHWESGTLIGWASGERYTYSLSADRVSRELIGSGIQDERGSFRIISDNDHSFVIDTDKPEVRYDLPNGDWTFGDSYEDMVFLRREHEWIAFRPEGDKPSVYRFVSEIDPIATTIEGDVHLLTRHDGEISLWRIGSDPEVLIRKSVQMTGTAMHRLGRDVFFSTETEIVALELDARDHRLETVLSTLDRIDGMSLEKRRILISGAKGEDSGIWGLNIE